MHLAVALCVVGACQQAPPAYDAPVKESTSSLSDKPANYQALPGQAATSSTPSETTTAFEFAAASMGMKGSGRSAEVSTSTGMTAPMTSVPKRSTPSIPPRPVVLPTSVDSAPPIPDPRPVESAVSPAPVPEPIAADDPPSEEAAVTHRGAAGISASRAESSIADAGYAVQMINGTSGRLFVEVQDDSGNIFPFGFMYAGQRIASRPQDSRPISGQLTVIIRDPDQPGAPELRRYKVQPAENYMGHTLGVTILPGGRYRAAVDGKVYYSTPERDTPAEN